MTQSKTNSMINGWSPLTTRLLCEGGNNAWNVIDQILPEDDNDDESTSCCDGLLQEISHANLIDQLKPAKTKGESDISQLLATLLLSSSNTSRSTSTSTSTSTTNDNSNSSAGGDISAATANTTNTTNNIRGDKSIFISREYRSKPDFATNHPYFQQLITTITTSIKTKLQHTINFDLEQTSVQLAVYPGDGQSGYPRHCDRGHNSCLEEGQEGTTTNPSSSVSPSLAEPSKRIITVVYYLTDSDWNGQLDGGCLRIFSSSNNENSYHDVIPYRNRMIIFRSDGVQHQVMPSLRRSRMAITIWMYGNLKQQKDNEQHQQQVSTVATAVAKTTSIAAVGKKIDKPETGLPPSIPTSDVSVPGQAGVEKVSTDHDESKSTILQPPPLQVPDNNGIDNQSLSTIFVSIASYRDSETIPTIQSLFETAKYPQRIVVGLVLQLLDDDNHDKRIWNQTQNYQRQNPKHKLRIIKANAKDSTGPCNARGQCQTLFRDEEYVLQIDSHMRFRSNWDEYLIYLYIQEQQQLGQELVLTAYPVGYQLPNQIPNETRGTLLVPWKFDDNGMLRQRGRLLVKQRGGQQQQNCVPCHLYAAGFNFSSSSIINDVPYDPHNLHQLFFGEESSISVRLFTSGYQLLSPPESIVYHLWSRSHRPTQQQEKTNNDSTQIQQQQKLQQQQREHALKIVRDQLMGESNTIGTRYGLGTVRTVDEYWNALTVDFENQKLNPGCENGVLNVEDFVSSNDVSVDGGEGALFPVDSIESKVAGLDNKSKQLIAFFLGNIG